MSGAEADTRYFSVRDGIHSRPGFGEADGGKLVATRPRTKDGPIPGAAERQHGCGGGVLDSGATDSNRGKQTQQRDSGARTGRKDWCELGAPYVYSVNEFGRNVRAHGAGFLNGERDVD